MNTLLSPDRQYERFEPITVRAAARVLQLQKAGVVSANEAAFYLRELVAMDAHAGEDAFPSLVRAARRGCAATRPVAMKAKTADRTTSRHQAPPRATPRAGRWLAGTTAP